jgi:membrane dipeptidase
MPPTAAELHASAIIIDGHNDSFALRLERGDPLDLTEVRDGYHVDLPRLAEGGVTAMMSYCGSRDLPQALTLIEAINSLVQAHPDDFCLISSAADIRAAKVRGRIGLIPQLESLSCCMGEVRVLAAMYRLGLRVGNLSHGEAPPHGCQGEESVFDYCSAADRERLRREMEGLTDFGRAAIAEMNRLGIVVDLAHANDAAFYEALELSATPPIFSHGCVFSICPHSRGLTDEQIRLLAQAGGVHGVACYTRFIHREHPDMPTLVDHIEHSINLVGPDHVGLGADYDGLPETEIPVPPHVGLLPRITEEMDRRGWDEATIGKVLGGNFLRVLEAVL